MGNRYCALLNSWSMLSLYLAIFACYPYLCYGSIYAVPSSCAASEIEENYTDPFVSQALKRSIIHDIWKSPLFSKLTPLLRNMRDILIEMADSDSFVFTDIAFAITGLNSAMLANADTLYPSFCTHALIINKTVEYKEKGTLESYFEAANATADLVEEILSSFRYNVLSQMGCKNLADVKHGSRKCWKNGFVSHRHQIFHLYGNLLPCSLRNTIEELFESPVFSDKAQGVIATLSLAPTYGRLFQEANFVEMVQEFIWFSTASTTSKCCCEEWSRVMEEAHAKRLIVAHENAKEIIDELLHPCNEKVDASSLY